MLTIEALKAYGADTQTGLQRCVNREALYFRLVRMIPVHEGFAKLEKAIEEGALDVAFSEAHGLKGVVSNLSLTPLSDPITEITEHLRAGDKIDYSGLMKEIMEQRKKLEDICAD